MSADGFRAIRRISAGAGYLRADRMEGYDPIAIYDELIEISGECDTEQQHLFLCDVRDHAALFHADESIGQHSDRRVHKRKHDRICDVHVSDSVYDEIASGKSESVQLSCGNVWKPAMDEGGYSGIPSP